MKTKIFLLMLVTFSILATSGYSQSVNKLFIPTVECGLGKDISIPIYLTNEAGIVATQFKMHFPENCTVNSSSVTLSDRKVDHTATVKSLGNNDYLFVIFSAKNTELRGNSGILLRITVKIPETWAISSTYPVTFNQVILSDLTGKNIASVSESGLIKVVAELRPDVNVQNITINQQNVSPLGKLNIAWQVMNIGDKITGSGWSEQVSLINEFGEQVLLGTTTYDELLDAGSLVSRQAEFSLPEYPGLDATATIQVKVIPNSTLGELITAQSNNIGQSSNSISISKKLSLTIATKAIQESNISWIQCRLFRSGSRATDQTFALVTSFPDRLKVPESVTIKAGQSGVVFYINSIDNNILNADSTVIISAKGIGYNEISDSINIIDNEMPSLSINASLNEVNEGNVFTLTIAREVVTNTALEVILTTDYSKRFGLTSEVTIPANEKSVTISVPVVDDAIPALTISPIITASAFGHTKASCTVTLNDNDIPAITLSLAPTTITESAGYLASIGIVRRQGNTDNVITIKLTDDANGGLYYSTPMIVLEKGVSEKQFTIAVVDNAMVDGNKEVSITAAVYISSCGCSTAGTGAGMVQSKLTILDDDGPTLKITTSQSMLPEGKTQATLLTISRNTSTGQSLSLTVSSDRDADMTYQKTVTIPSGTTSITIPIDVINNNMIEGDRTVTITATADGFTKGVCWAMITDQTLADATVNVLSVTPTNPLAKGTIQSEVLVTNSGIAPLAAHTSVDIYLCNTTSLSSSSTKQLLTTIYTSKDIVPQGNESLFAILTLPDFTGQYYLIAQVDDAQTQKELSYLNNISEAQSLKLLPSYTVNVTTDKNTYKPGDVVVLSGKAVAQGDLSVSGVAIDVYVINNGYRQSLKATTNATGAFQVNFTPYSGQMGHFVAGACYPNEALTTEQVAFDIYGLKRTSNENIIWDILINEQNTGEIEIINPGSLPLSGLKTTIISNTATGAQLSFDALNDMGAGGTAKLKYTLTGSVVSTSQNYDQVKFQVTTNEGASFDFTAFYYCRSPKATLKASLSSIQTTMSKDAVRTYQFSVTNNGKGASGKVNVMIPTTSWMSLITTAEIPSLAYGESSNVVLQLSPTADMVANTSVNGSIIISCENGNSFPLAFNIETVSDKTGALTVDVCDEYTYYTSQAPHLVGAKVVVKHPYTGVIISQGITDANGLFSVENLPEGYYTVVISAEKHDSYTNNLLVDPGKTTKTTVNLSFQAITYTWNVEETTVPDVYTTETVVKYETNVPTPIVEMFAPAEIKTDDLQQGESLIYNVVLTNKGLITAKDVIVNVPKGFQTLKFETLIDNGFNIKPLESVVVPVKVTRISAMQQNSNNKLMAKSTDNEPCYDYNYVLYFWDCGLDRKWHEYPQTIKIKTCPTTSTNVTPYHYTYNPVYSSGPSTPNPTPYTTTGPIYTTPDYTTTPIVINKGDCEPCQNSFTFKMGKCFVKQIPIVQKVLEMVETLECVNEVVNNKDLKCVLEKVFTPEWVENIVGYIDLYDDCIKPLLEPCVPGDFGLNSVKSQKAPAINNMPSYIQHFQEVLKNTRIVANSVEEQTLQIFGDTYWLNVTGGELSLFWNTLMKNNGVVSVDDLELKKCKPASISEDQYVKFIERWNNTISNIKVNNFIDFDLINQKLNEVSIAKEFAKSLGYTTVNEMFNKEYEIYQKKADEAHGSVCASISLKFSQTMTMTRQAFRGTLSVYNGHETAAMQNVKLNLIVKDSEGNIVIQNSDGNATGNQLFQINPENLDKLTAIDGTGTLNAKVTGTASIMFIPTKYAAPLVSKIYTFGGTLSYLDPFTGLVVTRDLYPVTMTVKPSPDLTLTYFMQRDVLGDDPLTSEVESMEPSEFSLLINNVGAGDATNVKFTSSQPQVIKNEKGLLTEFKMIGSSLNGAEKTLGWENLDFGNILSGNTTYGQWWFTNTLLGHFTEYNTTVTHVTSYGNPDLSLVSEVSIHELIRSLSIPTSSGSVLTGFMANDIPDGDDIPDMLYLSDGKVEEVNVVSSVENIKINNTTYSLTVTPSKVGWNYGITNDPGNGHMKLISVVRQSDNASISLRNFWQTDRTMRDGKDPLYENRIHFADKFTSGNETYTLSFEPKPDKVLEVQAITGIPEGLNKVNQATIIFNKPIDPTTFTKDDITLKCQSNVVDISNLKIISVSPSEYTLDLSTVPEANGYYLLTVQTTNITDTEGFIGEKGKQIGWTQYLGNVQITINVIPANSGKVTPNQGGFAYGQSVNIQATSEYGYRFKSWMLEGSDISSESLLSYIPVENKTLVANFDPKSYNVTLNNDASKGLVTGCINGLYEYKSKLNLIAVPNTDYNFVGWKVNDVDAGSNESLSLTVTNDLRITPEFIYSKIISKTPDYSGKKKSFMVVYPNPSNKGLGVNVEVSIPENEIKDCEIVVTSLIGSIIKTIPLTSNIIHVSDINSGMYLFKLKSSKLNTQFQKVIIQ